MKPYNLERALAGDPVVTRDGRPVKIAGYNEEAQYSDTLIGWLGGYYCRWNKEGQHFTACETDFDLFMAPTERKEWIVRCTDKSDKIVSFLRFFHPDDARKHVEEYESSEYYKFSIHEITITE